MLTLKEVTLVAVFVSDVKKLLPFYRDVLGFKVTWEDGDGDFAEFETSGHRFAIHSAEEASKLGLISKRREGELKTPVGVYFLVEDMEKAVEELKARGVEFTSNIIEMPFGKLATFVDFDGNELHLYQRYPE